LIYFCKRKYDDDNNNSDDDNNSDHNNNDNNSNQLSPMDNLELERAQVMMIAWRARARVLARKLYES